MRGADEAASSAEHRGLRCAGPAERIGRLHRFTGRRVAHVQAREAIDDVVVHVEIGVGHPQRFEDAGAEELVERHSRHDLDQSAEHVGRHAVVPLGAGLERERHRGPHRTALGQIGARWVAPLETTPPIDRIGHVGVVEAVGETRRVRQEMPHPDRLDERFGHRGEMRTRSVHPGVGELGKPRRDRRFQLEQALLVQHHGGHRRDRLRHREHPHDRVVGERQVGSDVAVAHRR